MKTVERIDEEITKTKGKISELQTRLRDLEKQKKELEDREYLSLVRGIAATPGQLHELLKTLQGNQKKEESGENET
jgi:septal ring factor EnvC (AmiA/AmiB activator)